MSRPQNTSSRRRHAPVVIVVGTLLASLMAVLGAPVQAQGRTVQEADTVTEIVAAADYDTTVDAEVLRLYQAFFNRLPDAEGVRYWLDIRREHSLLEISEAFALSEEFANNYDGTDDRTYLTRVYTNVLGRGFDQSGFDYWLDTIQGTNVAQANPEGKKISRGAVVRWITANDEFICQHPFYPEGTRPDGCPEPPPAPTTTTAAPTTTTTATPVPIAMAADLDDQYVHRVGKEVGITAAGSDPVVGSTLTYSWELIAAPEGSEVVLDDPTTIDVDESTAEEVMFTPDRYGIYTAQLTITNEQGTTGTATVDLDIKGDLILNVNEPRTGGGGCITPDSATVGSGLTSVRCDEVEEQYVIITSDGLVHLAANFDLCWGNPAAETRSDRPLLIVECDPAAVDQIFRVKFGRAALKDNKFGPLDIDFQAVRAETEGSVARFASSSGPNKDPFRIRTMSDLEQRVKDNLGQEISFPLPDNSYVEAIMWDRELQSKLPPVFEPIAAPHVVYPTQPDVSGERHSATVSIDRNKLFNPHEKVVNWEPTGLFAVPGELITITVPDDAPTNGLLLQISGHTDDLYSRSADAKRPDVTQTHKLYPGTHQYRVLYGGLIFIRSDREYDTVVDVTVDGALLTPHFKLGETTLAEWQTIREYPGTMAVMEGEKFIWMIPSDLIREVDDPTQGMIDTDQYTRWVEDLQGMDQNATSGHDVAYSAERKWLYNMDIQISNGYGHAGQPIQTVRGWDWTTNPDRIGSAGGWGYWHELSHNYQEHAWSAAYRGTEVTVNIPSMYVYEKFTGEVRSCPTGWHRDFLLAKTAETLSLRGHYNLVFYDQMRAAVGGPDAADFWGPIYSHYRELGYAETLHNGKSQDQGLSDMLAFASEHHGVDLSTWALLWNLTIEPADLVRMQAQPAPTTPIADFDLCP